MRKLPCVLMIILCLTGCGGEAEPGANAYRLRYQEAGGCTMTATVRCTEYGAPWEAVLSCTYSPDGERVVEVVSPETIAGVKVVLHGDARELQSDGRRLNAGRVSAEGISPADALPALVDALRDGWLLEENEEDCNGVACTRLLLDTTGAAGEKLYFTIWLNRADGAPVRGEIAVGEETVMSAEFTSFSFSGTIEETAS